MSLVYTPKIITSLDGLEKRKKGLLKLGKAMMEAYEGAMYPVDLLALGALKRTISTIAGFKLLIESSNMVCARTILRVQIDTALRFYSVFIVDNPHTYSMDILSGKQINHMKDSSGKQMRDAYLVQKLAEEYPWLSKVYKNLSGYIHFSESHLFHPVQEIDDESRSIKYAIQEEDTKFPEFSWVEVIDCFSESVDIFTKYLEGWVFTKANPALVAKLKKEKAGEQQL
jgi:hypothetical protein